MARTRSTLALCLLLSSAPLLGVSAAVADEPAPAAPTEGPKLNLAPINGNPNAPTVTVERDLAVPATPVPMNLPDEAKQSEVNAEVGFGVSSLVIGAVLTAAIVIGALFLISRRNWSAQH